MSITRSQVFLVVSLVVWSLVLLKLFELHQGPAVGTEIPPVIVASQSNSPSTTVAQISPVVSKPSPPPPPPPIVEQKALTGDSALHKLTVAVKAISFASNAVANLTSPSTPPPRAYPRSIEDYRVKNLPWQEFSRSPHDIGAPDYGFPSLPNSVHVCPQEVVDKLNERLSDEDLNWCKWALRADGGQVQVGKSYGKLNSRDREKYEQLNCNAVAKGDNPSCNDAWGDNHVLFWKRRHLPDLCGPAKQFSSQVRCIESTNLAKFCEFENALLDLTKMHNVKRPGRTDSRKWDPGFLATHCDASKANINYYEFYAPVVDAKKSTCDFVLNETVLIYGHDDIRNLGHSMSDFMNVWTMLWLSSPSRAASSKHLIFLNADAIRMGHNYYDDLGTFAPHYTRQFGSVLKLSSFPSDAKICAKHVLFMPRPVVLYTWDGWWQDMRCSFAGPSSLYQRWNLQVRRNYNLLPHQIGHQEDSTGKLRVLFILRKSRTGSSQQTSRVIKNSAAIQHALSNLTNVHVTALDLSTLSFEEQVRTMARTHLVVGMHGAGISASMHMNIGGDNCCGVVEIFPVGEFKPIRGYGNMARRMGHHYERLDLGGAESHGDGAVVNIQNLVHIVRKVIDRVRVKPTCILPSVLSDPFLEKV